MPSVVKADNTKMETARPVTANQWVTDTMGSASQRYYSFTLPSKGSIHVEFRRKTAGTSSKSWAVILQGIDSAQGKYKTITSDTFSGATTDSHYLPRIGAEKGTYYLQVLKSSNTDKNLEFQFCIHTDAAAGWETEFNETFATANIITPDPGKTVSTYGTLRSGADVDYYAFTLPEEGYVQFSQEVSQNLSDSGNWYVSMYDADTKYWLQITCNNKDKLQGKSARIGLPAGTYYLKAGQGTNNSSDPYRLDLFYQKTAGWEHEQNKSYNEADAAENDKLYSASLMSATDIDWWCLEIPETGRYQLNFRYERNKESAKTWVFRLEDDNKKMVENRTFREKEEPAKCTPVTLDKGTYYVKVISGTYWSQEDYRWSMNRIITPVSIKTAENVAKGLKVTWSAGADAKEYILQRKAGSGDWADVASTAKTSYLDAAVVNGTKYQYRVLAAAGGFRSDPSGAKTAWRLTAPSIATKKPAAKSVTITWKKNEKASGYQVQIAKNSKFTSGKKTYKVKKAGTVKYTIKKLKWKTTYYIRIRAYKSSTSYVSAWSKAVKVKTK